jgi:hypothetical protein
VRNIKVDITGLEDDEANALANDIWLTLGFIDGLPRQGGTVTVTVQSDAEHRREHTVLAAAAYFWKRLDE